VIALGYTVEPLRLRGDVPKLRVALMGGEALEFRRGRQVQRRSRAAIVEVD